MQVVENWADIRGVIRGFSESNAPATFVTAQVEVLGVSPVVGFPNLFANSIGQTITVSIPQAALKGWSLRLGQRVTCRVRRAGPHSAFAHPDRVVLENH